MEHASVGMSFAFMTLIPMDIKLAVGIWRIYDIVVSRNELCLYDYDSYGYQTGCLKIQHRNYITNMLKN